MDPRGADVNGSKLIFPGLADFYARMEPIAYTITRVVFGFIMIMHGWPKWTRGAEAIGTAFANNYGLPRWFAPLAIFFEVVGGAALIAGIATRFFAADAEALGPVRGGGYEYVMFLGFVCFYIAIRGGGPYSVDAKLGKEL